MPVSFPNFPANWKLPLTWIDIDPSKAGTLTLNQPAMIMGHKLSAGSATTNTPYAVASVEAGRSLFGEGSMLDRMLVQFFKNAPAANIYAIAVPENSGGTAATGSINVTNPATAAGILSLYIAGQLVEVTVGASDSAVAIAANVVAAINAKASLPVSATQGSNPNDFKALLTCKWKGLTGNDIDLRYNYLGPNGGEALPAGVTVTFTAMASGAGAPSLTAGIAALGEEVYDYVAMPWTDSASLATFDAEFGFSDTGRWGWMRELYGTVFTAWRGADSGGDHGYAALAALGDDYNYPTISPMAIEAFVPMPVWEVAAAYCAEAAKSLLNDPARPLQTLELLGILPAQRGNRFSLTNLNNLAGLGMAIQTTNANGRPMIMREQTQYQKNTYGQPDNAYELVTTLHTLAAIFRRLRTAINGKYPRHKLANDGTRFGPGQAIVTPNIIRAELVAEYGAMEFVGLVENRAAFKENLIVERDPDNPNRVNVQYPPDLINQLRIFAVLGQFRLQFATN